MRATRRGRSLPPSLAPLGHREFVLVAAGNFVSQLGLWSQVIGIGWAAQDLTDSAFLFSLAFGAQFLPTLVIGPVGGVVADRFDRRRATVVGNVVMTVPPAIIGFLLQIDGLAIWSLVVLAFVGGTAQALTQPAMAALVPYLVPQDEIPAAVSLNSAIQNASRFVGGALAGLLISVFGTAAAFYFNAASFFAVVVAWLLVRVEVPPAPTSTERFFARLSGGLRYARGNQAVRDLLLIEAVVALAIVQQPLLAIIIRQLLDAGAGIYGLANTVVGVGAITGALLAGRPLDRGGRSAIFALAVAAIPVAIFATGVSRSVPLTMVVLAIFGTSFFVLMTMAMSTMILVTPDEYRGRVLGLHSMAVAGIVPVNAVLAGALASATGLTATIVGAACLLAVYSTWFLMTGRARAVDARPQVSQA